MYKVVTIFAVKLMLSICFCRIRTIDGAVNSVYIYTVCGIIRGQVFSN